MTLQAYAVRLNEDNYQAIASEKPGFDLEETRLWAEDHGGGFFIRDEETPAFDCKYMSDVVFHEIYKFERFSPNDVFHKIVLITSK